MTLGWVLTSVTTPEMAALDQSIQEAQSVFDQSKKNEKINKHVFRFRVAAVIYFLK